MAILFGCHGNIVFFKKNFTRRFLRLIVLLVFSELTIICLTIGNKWVQKINRQYNISDDIVYEWLRFFIGQVYDWGRFQNTGSHTRVKIIPKLSPPSSPTKQIEFIPSKYLIFVSNFDPNLDSILSF